jgi:hypothetical protein
MAVSILIVVLFTISSNCRVVSDIHFIDHETKGVFLVLRALFLTGVPKLETVLGFLCRRPLILYGNAIKFHVSHDFQKTLV